MHFSQFIEPLEPLLRSLLVGLFTLLSRFTAHSASSGHTPPTLSPLFGPLLFGLGPSTLNFHHAYLYYLRATTATEHLILAFIRWQDAKATAAGPTMSVPTRLKAWIQGYPAMLPMTDKNERPEPRRGARTVRVLSVRRNVRMYSPDLVKTAAGWGTRPRGAPASVGERGWAGSREWERIAPPTLKLPPRYSDQYKKRMDLGPNFHPDTGPGANGAGAGGAGGLQPPSLSSSVSSASSVGSSLFEDKEGEERFRSLTDLRWGEFEAMGFGSLADEKKLQFDLTESARAVRFPFPPSASLVHVSRPLSRVVLTPVISVSLAGARSEAGDAVLAGLLLGGVLAERRAPECDAAIQRTGREHDQRVARAPGGNAPQAEEDAEGAARLWMGHGPRRRRGGGHRRSVRGRLLRLDIRWRLDG